VFRTIINIPRKTIGYALMAVALVGAIASAGLVKLAAWLLDITITKTQVTAEEVTREDIDTDELRKAQAEYLAAKAKRDYPPED